MREEEAVAAPVDLVVLEEDPAVMAVDRETGGMNSSLKLSL